MDKREAGFRRDELNKELAELWEKVGIVQEQLMQITTRGKEENWTMERYKDERAPLMAEKATLGDRIKPLTEELKQVNSILGIS